VRDVGHSLLTSALVGEVGTTQAKPSFGSACFSIFPSIARTDKGFAETLSVSDRVYFESLLISGDFGGMVVRT